MRKISTYFFVICFLFSCHDEAGTLHETLLDDSFIGEWLLVERGYSPGSGYITQEVPENPPQTIRLSTDFRLSTNIQGLTKYKFYRILYDTLHDQQVLAFFESPPIIEPRDMSNLDHSYSVMFEESTMKLFYRWCFEGCHYSFRRIETVSQE